MLSSHNLARIPSIRSCSISWSHGCPQKFELQRLPLAAAVCMSTSTRCNQGEKDLLNDGIYHVQVCCMLAADVQRLLLSIALIR